MDTKDNMKQIPECMEAYIQEVKKLFRTFAHACASESLGEDTITRGVDSLFDETMEQMMRDLLEYQRVYQEMSVGLERMTKKLNDKIQQLQEAIDEEEAGEGWKKS